MRALSRLPLAVAAASAGLLLVAGPGVREGLWGFRTGFSLLQWAAFGGLSAAGAAAAAALGRPAEARAQSRALLAAGLLGLGSAAVPWAVRRSARSVPPIHDISTDTQDPPPFVAALQARRGAPNPAEYGGPEVARRQAEAYPDLRPLAVAGPPGETFARALEAARDLGWEIVAAEPSEGRIEATDATFWFGFKDDVVIRVRPDGPGASRLDVRSVSRVGKGDAGANARRIRRLLRRL
ncbi:MAG: DUF1499 domain-containing protein [Elusimicrobia bacterium]|nr:DUF1499 domain-containing protein [Elusimicrobiota bacterium]